MSIKATITTLVVTVLGMTFIKVQPVNASEIYVGLRTLQLYAMSTTAPHEAHLVSVGGGGIYNSGADPHPECGYRMYIDFNDKQLFAAVLAASLAGEQMALTYDDEAPEMDMGYHGSYGCKLLSVWGFP